MIGTNNDMQIFIYTCIYTINGLSANNNNTNLTRQIPVKSNKKKCVIGDSNMRGLAKQLKPKLDNPDAVCVYKTSGMRIGHLIPRLKGYTITIVYLI